MGGLEAGSEPFFFPKFPVQSTVSLWMTTADMAASPGADSAPRRVPSTLQEKSRGFRGWVQRHTPPVVCTPGLFPHRTLHTAPLPGSPPCSPHPGSLQSLGSQAMPLQWAPTLAAVRAAPLESVLYVGLPHESFVRRNIFLAKYKRKQTKVPI